MAIDINIEIDLIHEINLDIGPINNITASLVDNYDHLNSDAFISLIDEPEAECRVSLVSLVHSPPVNPLCVPLKNGAAFFHWNMPNENVLKYEIFISLYNSMDENKFTLIETTVDNMVFIRGLPINTSMYFKIRAMYIDDSFSEFSTFKRGKIAYGNHNFRIIAMPGTVIPKDAIIPFTEPTTGYPIRFKNLHGLTL
jgi:hypothetical protein